MDSSLFWRGFLAKWPAGLQRRGVVVANGEQVKFTEFLIGEQAVLFERIAPDSVGGRKLIVLYKNIEAIKITESVDNDAFVPCGFLPAAAMSNQTS